MAPNSELNAVIAHLKNLSTRIAERMDIHYRRDCIDEYFGKTADYQELSYIEQVNIDGINGFWIRPNTEAKRCIFYIHGGSWMSGSIKGYHVYMRELANSCEANILFIDYALIPENPFPAGLEDCLKGYRWLLDKEDSLPISVAGDSAGGNLTLCLLLLLKDRQLILPKTAIAISPCTDMSFSNPSLTERQAQDPIINGAALPLIPMVYAEKGTDLLQPYISPIYGDLRGLPPLLIQTGMAEVLLDDSVKFAEKASDSKVEVDLDLWEDMPHVFQGFAPALPEARAALKKIASFLDQHKA